MRKNQLFKINPDSNIIEKILDSFGLSDLEDTRYFTYKNMSDSKTVERLEEMKDELSTYYLPRKGKVYLGELTNKKCLTILRQFIRSYNYKCLGIEKSIKGKKQMTYRLTPIDTEQLSPTQEDKRTYVIEFN